MTERQTTVSQCVAERFPDWRTEVLQLLKESDDFRELCTDYRDLASWLAACDRSVEAQKAAVEEGRVLLRELEQEILDMLQARFKSRAGREDALGRSSPH